MKNNVFNIIIKIVIFLAIIAIGVFSWIMYSNAKEDSKKDKDDKIEKEIEYLDAKLTSLINALNGIQLENYKVSINKIQEEEEESNSGESQEKNSEKSGEKEEEEGTSNKETKITKVEQELTGIQKETNWDWIKGEAEVFYSVWATIVLDLYDIDAQPRKNCRI